MGNNSKSSVVYQGKIPGRVKYAFAFGALGKDLIYGMIVDNTRSRFGKFVPWLAIGTLINAFVFIYNCIYRFSSDRCEALRLCDGCIYFMGNDLYHHGYSILVSDSESDF